MTTADIAAIAILVVSAAVLAGGVVVLVRNKMVWSYRDRLLSAVSDAAQADIKAGRYWEWRYDAFDAVSYYAMVFQLWRRFDDFYVDQSFIRMDEPR